MIAKLSVLIECRIGRVAGNDQRKRHYCKERYGQKITFGVIANLARKSSIDNNFRGLANKKLATIGRRARDSAGAYGAARKISQAGLLHWSSATLQGGAGDIIAGAIGEKLAKALGQPVNIEYRSEPSSLIASRYRRSTG
jgi:hypothetical protein